MVAVPVVHLREGDAGGGPSKQGQNKAMEGECNEGMRRPARSSTPHKAEKKPHPSSAKARETELGSGHRLDVRKGKLTGVVVPNHGKEARVACPFPHELLKGRGTGKMCEPRGGDNGQPSRRPAGPHPQIPFLQMTEPCLRARAPGAWPAKRQK